MHIHGNLSLSGTRARLLLAERLSEAIPNGTRAIATRINSIPVCLSRSSTVLLCKPGKCFRCLSYADQGYRCRRSCPEYVIRPRDPSVRPDTRAYLRGLLPERFRPHKFGHGTLLPRRNEIRVPLASRLYPKRGFSRSSTRIRAASKTCRLRPGERISPSSLSLSRRRRALGPWTHACRKATRRKTLFHCRFRIATFER